MFQALEAHPNGMVFHALDAAGRPLLERDYYSVGGGFILSGPELCARLEEEGIIGAGAATQQPEGDALPYSFGSARELLEICAERGCTILDIVSANEAHMHRAEGGLETVHRHLDRVWDAMQECVSAGLSSAGELPGGLNVQRRAAALRRMLDSTAPGIADDGFRAMEWVNLYAMAVNEQNAAGGTVVTAPTNGAAGIIPAVMHYARDFLDSFGPAEAREFLLTAGAVGAIIKENASISGAEVGCQGEVGSACAMAAAGLCCLLGGTPRQIANAAEIGLEHNLGLTCDPVGGLVQIPCIERNAIGAVKAINAARLARLGDGTNRVSLDDVVSTMAATGRDMLTKYKETATGGLAVQLGLPVNITEC